MSAIQSLFDSTGSKLRWHVRSAASRDELAHLCVGVAPGNYKLEQITAWIAAHSKVPDLPPEG